MEWIDGLQKAIEYIEEHLTDNISYDEIAKQWLLRGAASDYYTDYCVIKNINDNGYDFFIANELNEWTRENLYNKEVTGVDFMSKMNFEEIIIPKRLIYSFCSSDRGFASDFLQTPSHGGRPCLWLTVHTAKPVADFHRQVITHAEHTAKRVLHQFAIPFRINLDRMCLLFHID